MTTYYSSLGDFGGDVAEASSDFDFTTDIYEPLLEMGGATLEFLNENEWAANLVGGAAAGAAAYKLQEDAQAHERDLLREKQRFEVDVNTSNPVISGNIATGLSGALTNGLLAPKKQTP